MTTYENGSKSLILKPLFKTFLKDWGASLFVLFFVLGSLAYYFLFYRVFREIDSLKTHYYILKSNKDPSLHVEYELTAKKPKIWASLESMPKYVPQAFVVSEDSFFYTHPGYDLEAMRMAFKEALLGKKKLRGGSTINQQLAKNLFLNSNRSLTRKVRELIFAINMNEKLPKKRIMELYLNVIEFGPNVWGIGNASRYYFKKTPSQLSPKEAAFLAILLPNPKKYSQSFRNKVLSRFARRSIQRVLRKLMQTGHLSKERYLAQLSASMVFERNVRSDQEEFIAKARGEIGITDTTENEDRELEELNQLEATENEVPEEKTSAEEPASSKALIEEVQSTPINQEITPAVQN